MDARPLSALVLGCLGAVHAASPPPPGDGDEVTYSEHVAPILFRSCLPCHREGESAPFALEDYASAQKRAGQIARVTSSRYMPPWLPTPGHGDFEGSRRLGDDEVATLARWAEAGAPEGDPARLPPLPPAAEGWQLGTPDLVVTLPEPWVVPAEGLDVWRNFVVPIPVDRRRFVEGVELRPGNKRVVHHAVIRVDRTSSSRDLDEREPGAGFEGMDLPLSEAPGGQFLGWTPGRLPRRAPAGLGWTLDPGTDLVVQLHMLPTGKPEPIQFSVGFFFTDVPPTNQLMVLRLRNDRIDIPPGEAEYVVEDTLDLGADVLVTKIYPHAHFLGKRVETFGLLPDGRREDLIRIDDWDFNWQDEYQYATPVRLPRGTRLTMRITFDNSGENPRNPHVPPIRVRSGNSSLDEMATVTLQVLTESGEARNALREAACRHRVEESPDSWAARLNLGAILAERGRFREAAEELRAGLALEPGSVDLHRNLGGVLASLNDPDGARRCFEEALRLAPGDPEVHANLALLEGALGHWEEAARHFRAVLEKNAQDGRALRGLATALARLERLDEAREVLERAVTLDPRDAQAQALRGTIALRQQRLEDATQAFLASLEAHPSPEVHLQLARVYAARGMRAEAERHQEEAKRLAAKKRE